jgi:uncharacterized protein (TIGR04255 family)
MQEDIKFRTIINNNITQFILRIDFHLPAIIKFEEIISKLADTFDRTEKRLVSNFIVENHDGDLKINKKNSEDYVMISESPNLSVTFSPTQAAIWLETTNYKNSSTYKDIMGKIIEVIISVNSSLKSRRIGLRYINEFKCPKSTQIKTFVNSIISKNILAMVSKKNISRIISQEEYNFENSKLRLQYGILNKFYPSILNNYDLLLDVDSFDDAQQNLSDFEMTISNLNHRAYEIYFESINKKYLAEISN